MRSEKIHSMKIKTLITTCTILGLSFACKQPAQDGSNEESTAMKNDSLQQTEYVNDPHSYSRPNEATVKHLNLGLEVDFENEMLRGVATWEIKTSNTAETIVFDTYDLYIESVKVDGKSADFKLGKFNEEFGSPLKIAIEPGAEKVSIEYTTGDSARALQFLDPQQTAGKKMPFLFTQSQAILARSWVPTQDSPGIRFTYDASVSVPENMLALMSASNPQEKSADGQYSFTMEQPIPSYLLALAAGDIKFDSIGPRSGVYAEPSVLEKASYEFANLEKMIDAAESLYGPYEWDRYDLIVLPPSFPFGGMENPRLTFATPTILAGDRSLVALVAHELAHSWSGNLVTNATWSDFWLNEGFTVYFEQRIMEELYGRDYSEMLASLTRDDLVETAAEMMKENPGDTKLKLNLEGRNPDDAVNPIPYDKGYFFLRLIEETVGRERFDNFLKDYFDANKFKVMTTEGFVERLKENLLSEEEFKKIGVREWIYEPGLPDNLPEVNSDRFARVDQHLEEFLSDNTLPHDTVTENWTTHEWLHMINALPVDKISKAQLSKLDKAYNLTQSGNSEIAAAWFQPTIRNDYETVYPRVEKFLINVGRRKFLTPTYRALLESGKEEMAMEIYQKARPNYHAVSRDTMDDLLGYNKE